MKKTMKMLLALLCCAALLSGALAEGHGETYFDNFAQMICRIWNVAQGSDYFVVHNEEGVMPLGIAVAVVLTKDLEEQYMGQGFAGLSRENGAAEYLAAQIGAKASGDEAGFRMYASVALVGETRRISRAKPIDITQDDWFYSQVSPMIGYYVYCCMMSGMSSEDVPIYMYEPDGTCTDFLTDDTAYAYLSDFICQTEDRNIVLLKLSDVMDFDHAVDISAGLYRLNSGFDFYRVRNLAELTWLEGFRISAIYFEDTQETYVVSNDRVYMFQNDETEEMQWPLVQVVGQFHHARGYGAEEMEGYFFHIVKDGEGGLLAYSYSAAEIQDFLDVYEQVIGLEQ